MGQRHDARLSIPASVDPSLVTGLGDELLNVVEDHFDADVTVRGDEIVLSGDMTEVKMLTQLFSGMFAAIEAGSRPDVGFVERSIQMLREDAYAPKELLDDVVLTHKGHAIRPKTAGQKRYLDAIRTHTITFGLGPAGTGKTFLAMAMAVAALRRKEVGRIVLTRPVVEAGESLGFLPGTLEEKVNPYTFLAMAMAVAALRRKEVGRIVLTRPVVEAGESLGFLPGTLEEKVNPYIRPLYDALYAMMDAAQVDALLELGTIEIAPLAFMRGRTLSDAFVILDEAQNTTPEQMKMFLTRLGFGSTFVVTGDASQTDLPGGASSLGAVRHILDGIDDIAFVELKGSDVVRHNLVAKIVAAYEAAATRQDTMGVRA